MTNIMISFLAIFLLTLSNPVWADAGGANVAPDAKSKTSIAIPAQIKVVTDMLRVLNEPDLANDLEKGIRSGRITIGSTGGARAVTGVNALDRSPLTRHTLGSGTTDNFMTISDDIRQEIAIDPRAAKNVNNLTNAIGWAMTLRHEYVHMGQFDPKPRPEFENPAYRETNKTGVAWYNTAKTELREALTAPPTQDNLEKIRQIRLRMEIVGKQLNETFNDMHARFADGSLNPDTWVTLDGARTTDVEDARKQNMDTMSRDQTQFDAAIAKFAAAVAPSAGSNAEMVWVLKKTKREDRTCDENWLKNTNRQIKIEEGKMSLGNPQGSVTVKWSLPPRVAKPGNLPLTAEGSRSGSAFYLDAGISFGYGSGLDDLSPLSSASCESPAGRLRQNICSVRYQGSIKGKGMLTFPPGAPGKQFRVFLHAWAGDTGDYSFGGRQALFEYIYEWASGVTQSSSLDESTKNEDSGAVSGAVFTDLSGDVQIRPDIDKRGWHAIKAGEPVPFGTHMRTGSNGSAVVTLPDGVTFHLKENTEIVIRNPSEKKSHSQILYGSLKVVVERQILDESLEIDMDQAVCEISGTTLILEGTEGKSTLKVIDGRVRFTAKADGKMLMVAGGNMVSAGKNGLGALQRFDTAYETAMWKKIKNRATPLRDSSITHEPPGKEQVFIDPTVGGRYVDNCLNWGRNCQKPAADNYCQRNGFSGAVSFTLANRRPTWVLGDGKECNADFCVGFSRIVCGGGTTSVPAGPGGNGWRECDCQWLAPTCTGGAVTGTTKESCRELGGSYWHTNGHCGKGRCDFSKRCPMPGHYCYSSQVDNDGSSTPADSGQWQSVGAGDCPGRDVASTTGPNPDPSKCTSAMRGQTAVCWGHGCTYKNIATGACRGGANPGRMYTCGGAARGDENDRKTNNSGNHCWSGHFTGTDISGYPMDITLSENNGRVEGGYRYYHRAQQKEVTAMITDTSLQGNVLRGRWKQIKGIVASGNFEWKWLPNAQCRSFEGTFDGIKYWGKMTKN